MREPDRWKSETLDAIFEALATSPETSQSLIFKGARVLARRLPSVRRQSLDIDTNLAESFCARHPPLEEQRQVLEKQVQRALRRYFESRHPVSHSVDSLTLKSKPPRGHPLGWNAFELRVQVRDLRHPEVRAGSFPSLVVDIAAPERLIDGSVEPLAIGEHDVRAYSLHRIAGEKLRAFLTSLPAYRTKLRRPGDVVRAKDLHDEALILRAYPLPFEAAFWRQAGEEFRVTCASRYVDCGGIETFREDWDATRRTYTGGSIVGAEVSFAEAEQALDTIVRFFAAEGLIPFVFPLP